MARQISEIYNSMIAEKETFSNLSELSPTAQIDPSQTLLTDLNSTSKVAIWRLIFYVCAVSIWINENLFDIFKAEVQTLVDLAIPSTLPWWVKTIKEYQYGDVLVWNGSKWIYSVPDATKKIIAQCAIIPANGVLTIKVATGSPLEPLSNTEKSALISYIDKISPVGTKYILISDVADKLKIAYTVYINPLILYYNSSSPTDVKNGSLLADSTVYPINDAISNYLQTLDSTDFNGVFKVFNLTQAIQNVNGVSNAVATIVQATFGSLPYINILTEPSQSYTTHSGYLDIDSDYPLTSQLTLLTK